MVQPGDEFGGWPKFLNVQVSPDESLLRQFNGVIFVGNVAKYEAIKPFMVPIDQGLRQPETLAPRLDRDLRVPCGLFTTVHLVQLISCEVEQLLILFGSKNSFHFENVL